MTTVDSNRCEACGQTFTTEEERQEHEHSVHPGSGESGRAGDLDPKRPEQEKGYRDPERKSA